MNYTLTIKARLDGKAISEAHKAIEILASINGVTLEESSFKPLDAPSILVDRKVSRTYSNDPRMVYVKSHKGRHGGATRMIDIPATLHNLQMTTDQILKGDWKKGSVEDRLGSAIRRRNVQALAK